MGQAHRLKTRLAWRVAPAEQVLAGPVLAVVARAEQVLAVVALTEQVPAGPGQAAVAQVPVLAEPVAARLVALAVVVRAAVPPVAVPGRGCNPVHYPRLT